MQIERPGVHVYDWVCVGLNLSLSPPPCVCVCVRVCFMTYLDAIYDSSSGCALMHAIEQHL